MCLFDDLECNEIISNPNEAKRHFMAGTMMPIVRLNVPRSF